MVKTDKGDRLNRKNYIGSDQSQPPIPLSKLGVTTIRI
ncbi:hypothetical protein M595_0376 [Lyngbya aestuarii BL J]|uniref:Uncharacterized protein n=1 Tax=Lyngbya aestuarii BL J TaxID=1348334 RepID=U7QTH6_9CYAN|nr:hypothetical protein M595_0376 [Lyngbya aestuarii BL J]